LVQGVGIYSYLFEIKIFINFNFKAAPSYRTRTGIAQLLYKQLLLALGIFRTWHTQLESQLGTT
jgi:hypothetical protein